MSKNILLEFISKEVKKMQQLDELTERKLQLEKELKEIFGFSQKEKDAKAKQELVKNAANEIRSLTIDDVPLFSKSTTNNRTSLALILRNVTDRMPYFAEAVPSLFNSNQTTIEIQAPIDKNEHPINVAARQVIEQFPLVIPMDFQNIAKTTGDGNLTVDLDSIKKGLMKYLANTNHISGMDSGLY